MPSLVEHSPPYRTTIHPQEKVLSAHSVNRKTQITMNGNKVETTVEDIHETIVIRISRELAVHFL